MSGGHYDYVEYRLNDIVDKVDEDLNRLGVVDEWGYVFEVEPEVVEVMKQVREECLALFDKIHNLDYVISGDSGIDILTKYLRDDNKS
jgi:hypothetical protein